MKQQPILVIDDDPSVRDACTQLLTLAGYPVVTVADGAEALDLLRNDSDFALILLDLEMPNVSGWELMREIAADHGLGRIPVVFITGVEPSGSSRTWLTKPVEGKALLEAVRRHALSGPVTA